MKQNLDKNFGRTGNAVEEKAKQGKSTRRVRKNNKYGKICVRIKEE